MRGIRLAYFDGVLNGRILFLNLLVLLMVTSGVVTSAQTIKVSSTTGTPDEPVYTAYRNVRIGSTASEVRKILGEPVSKSDEQDIFVFNEKEIATIVYDKDKKVVTISVDFTGDGSNPPTPMEVVGTAPTAKPDGSASMMIRYPKAGYWVCYNKSAATPATVSVTMQKMQ